MKNTRSNPHLHSMLFAPLPVLILFGFLLAGCGRIQMYPGPPLPQEEIALLDIGDVRIYTLDGIPISKAGAFEILPGKHVINASHNKEGYPEQPYSYIFTAQAGHRYLFSADYKVTRTLSWLAWVKDLTEDKTIGRMETD